MNGKIKKFFLTLATAVVVALCTLLAACGGGFGAVDQSSIKYDGSLITWTAVDKADGYIVSINGGNEYNASTNQFAYPVQDSEDRVEITITAKKKDKTSDPATKLFTRLPKIEEADITFDEYGKMSWQQVAGASEYILEINGKQERTAALEYNAFPKGQSNNIRIKPIAVDDSSFSEWSIAMNKEYLAVPTNVKYDGQFLSWTGSSFAAKYAVYVNQTKIDESTGCVFEYDSQNKSFKVEIQSLGNGTTSFHSDKGEMQTFVYLEEVKGFDIEDGILTWNEVEDADGYTVWMNGVEYPVTEAKFDKITANKEMNIKVRANAIEGTTFFSTWSEEKSYFLLATPQLKWDSKLKLDGEALNAISWNKVTGDVGGYNISVKSPDGTTRIDSVGADMVMYGQAQNEAFDQVGSYEVRIQSYPEAESNAYASVYSDPIYIVRLPAPTQPTSGFITSDDKNIKNGFTLSWNTVGGSVGYQIYKESAPLSGTVETASKTIGYSQFMNESVSEETVINFSIQALGTTKYFNTERRIILDSLSKDNLPAQVTVLAQPKDFAISGYTASWSEVTHAQGYVVSCNDQSTTTTLEYDLSKLPVGTVNNFGVCARGNGTDILPSNYTAGKKLVRLAAPLNITLDPTSDGDKLKWDSVAHADHYEAFWAGETEAVGNTNKQEDIYINITTASRALFMCSAANYWDANETTYYVTSPASPTVTFTKLATPEFEMQIVNDTHNYLVWLAPSNVQNVNVKYYVYDGNGVRQATVDSTQYDISALEAKDYTFKVQAIGETGKNYVRSEVSAVVAFTKLDTPEVEREDGKYVWTEDLSADGYTISQGEGNPVNLGNTETEFKPTWTKSNATGYQVEIYARGNGMNNGTVNSKSWKTTQVVKKANAPEFELSYHDVDGEKVDHFVENGQIFVTIKHTASNSKKTNGYVVRIGGVDRNIDASEAGDVVLPYTVEVANKYDVRVFARGGLFDDNDVYYVQGDSQDAQSLTIYDKTSGLQVELTKISWTAVSAPYGYELFLTIAGQEYTVTVTNSSIKYKDIVLKDKDGYSLDAGYFENEDRELIEITSAHIECVKVRVKGNGKTLISSDWIDKLPPWN